MKKIYHSSFLITLACAALCCSCQKDKTVNLTAVFADKSTSNAKVYIEDNYGYWQNGDAVSICSNGAKNNYLLAVDNANPHIATIPNVEEGAPYTAGYPAANVSDLGSGTLKLTIPSEQTYAKAAPYSGHTEKQRIVCPMAAYSDDGSVLRFYNVGAVLAVNILNSTGNALNLYAIEVESDNAPLTGKAAVTVNADGVTISGKTETSTMVTLSLSGSSFELGNGKDTCLYIPVLPISSEAKSKLTVHVKATNGDTKYTFHGISSAEDGVYINQGEMGSIPVTITTGTAAAFWGQGTETCPYLIENEDDLKQLRTLVNGASYGGLDPYNTSARFYKQTGNITLTETTWGASGNEAIGKTTPNYQRFCANYDGGGHWVDLDITELGGTANNCLGLFGVMGGGGSIKKLTVTGEITTVNANLSVGGIVGKITGAFTLENCRNEIALTTYNSAITQNCGGIVGNIDAADSSVLIKKCNNNGVIVHESSTKGNAGGICGYVTTGNVTFTDNTNYASISGVISAADRLNYGFGGICGACATSGVIIQISSCVNQGVINASGSGNSDYSRAGGIMGYSGSAITFIACVNKEIRNSSDQVINSVYGNKEGVGGIIGYCGGSITCNGCKNEGKVEGEGNSVGGIVGRGNTSVTIYGTTQNSGSIKGQVHVGGIIGYANKTYINSTSGVTYNSGVIAGTGGNGNGQGIGGIVGTANSGDENTCIKKCWNKANVTSTNSVAAGGIVGRAAGLKIDRCKNTGAVSVKTTGSYSAAGGIIGISNGGPNTIYIENCGVECSNICTSTDMATYSGGIVGYGRDNYYIRNCYSIVTSIYGSTSGAGVFGLNPLSSCTITMENTYSNIDIKAGSYILPTIYQTSSKKIITTNTYVNSNYRSDGTNPSTVVNNVGYPTAYFNASNGTATTGSFYSGSTLGEALRAYSVTTLYGKMIWNSDAVPKLDWVGDGVFAETD